MKNVNLLIWLTQLGFSVAVPPVAFILIAAWFRNEQGWGSWVIWAGVILGISCAIEGLRSCLKAIELTTKDKKEETPPVSYNDHS